LAFTGKSLQSSFGALMSYGNLKNRSFFFQAETIDLEPVYDLARP